MNEQTKVNYYIRNLYQEHYFLLHTIHSKFKRNFSRALDFLLEENFIDLFVHLPKIIHPFCVHLLKAEGYLFSGPAVVRHIRHLCFNNPLIEAHMLQQARERQFYTNDNEE